MSTEPRPSKPIVSEFAKDPEMVELVQLFVSELPQRVKALESAWSAGQLEALRRMAHQLRGASAGYGFPTLGESAGRLETDLKNLGGTIAAPGLDAVASQFKELVDLCNRVKVSA